MLISAYEASLERIAEELMGRRKWKQYQETVTQTYCNTDHLTATTDQSRKEAQTRTPCQTLDNNSRIKNEISPQEQNKLSHPSYEENHRQSRANVDQSDIHPSRMRDTDTSQKSGIATDFSNAVTSTSHNENGKNSENSVRIDITNTDASLNSTIHHSELLESLCLGRKQRLASPSPPPDHALDPIDWKPIKKCYFCVDGKLLTVNAKGELVAESASAVSEADQAQKQSVDSEGDSNESGGTRFNVPAQNTTETVSQHSANVNKLLASRLKDIPANMTSMDSMAARLAAIRSISGQLYPNLDFNWLLARQHQQHQEQEQQQQGNTVIPTTSNTSVVAVSPARKDSPNSSDNHGEQPLDLSSKPSPNSSISGDLKACMRLRADR